ncbi:hypothetical protein C3L33_17517, partial [Rhododendron williamsianum]
MKRVVKTDAGEMKVEYVVSAREARIGSIFKDELIEKRLKSGDVYRIPAGSTFYAVNTADGQQLHVICSVEKSDSIGWGTFQERPQFLAGSNSVLHSMRGPAFAAAFGVSEERLKRIVNAQSESTILPPASASGEKVKNEMVMGFEGIY